MPRETALSRRIREHCNALPHCKALKLPGGPHMERGTPDLLVVKDGRPYLFEVKVDRNKPTVLQAKRLEQWAEAGAIARPVWSLDEVVEAIGDWRRA